MVDTFGTGVVEDEKIEKAVEKVFDLTPAAIIRTDVYKRQPFCRVRVVYGEPMPAARFSMEGRRDLRKLRENKQAVLEAWEKL